MVIYFVEKAEIFAFYPFLGNFKVVSFFEFGSKLQNFFQSHACVYIIIL